MTSPIWPKMPATLVNRAVAAHSALGLAVGALLYIICLSGALMVFENEFAWWEEPAAPHIETLSPQAVAAGMEAVAAADEQPSSHLLMWMPRPDWPRGVAATDSLEMSVDGEGDLLRERHSPWAGFLVQLHYYLHLPSTFGMVIVGALGAVMVGLSISGLLAYPGIFRNAFTFRRNGAARVAEIDLHNRFAVWSAPFHIVVAFTGAWIGLFAIVGVSVAQLGFGGDRGAVSDVVYGWELPANPAPAPLPDIEPIMSYMAETHAEWTPFLVIVHEPETAGQHVQVFATHPNRLILGEYFNFNAAGVFQGTTGMSDGAIGQQVAESLYTLHFGWFGGLPVRLIYLALGLVLCVIIATGLNIYFIKRREKGRDAPRLRSMWEALIWGAPAGLALTLLGSVSGALGADALAPVFWTFLLVALVLAAAKPRIGHVSNILRFIAATALLAAAAVHAALYGAGAFDAPAVMWMGAALIAAAAALCAVALRRPRAAVQVQHEELA